MLAEGADVANVVLVCDVIVSHCVVEKVLDVNTSSKGGRIPS